jgi:deoxyribose-phosphate aldolase
MLINNIPNAIEHTLLKPNATASEIEKLCQEADKWGFYGVCVNGCWLKFASSLLKKSKVKLISTAGFPLGACSTITKAFEVNSAIAHGAHEVDFVLNIGWLKSNSLKLIEEEFQLLMQAAEDRPLKVILETCLLTDAEKKLVCRMAMDNGIAFVKTSTGFSTSGATVEDVKLMKSIVVDKAQVKASGGIRDADIAKQMLAAGATRLGTSAGVFIMEKIKSEH